MYSCPCGSTQSWPVSGNRGRWCSGSRFLPATTCAEPRTRYLAQREPGEVSGQQLEQLGFLHISLQQPAEPELRQCGRAVVVSGDAKQLALTRSAAIFRRPAHRSLPSPGCTASASRSALPWRRVGLVSESITSPATARAELRTSCSAQR